MKSLLAKILSAQVLAVVLALVVVAVITRVSLNHGFMEFLQRQETAVLDILAPPLAELYQDRGGWAFLRGHPLNWQRILRHSHTLQPEPGAPRAARRPPGGGPGGGPGMDPEWRWLRSLDRLRLRERLFLLDDMRRRVAGAPVERPERLELQPVEVNGEVVGWVGFAPMGHALPPEVERFLHGQIRVLLISLVIGLGLAALLGFILARHLSRPVRQLERTVGALTAGEFEQRAEVTGRDEFSRLARNVNRLAATLEKNRTARRRWIADIAHELRTPVAILKGETEALADGLRPADEAAMASLREEIEQLSLLVEDLQTLALADAGALNLKLQQVDVADLVRQVAASFHGRLAARDIRLELRLQEPLPAACDPGRLRQMLHNLLENGARYVSPGGLLRVTLSSAEDIVQLAIDDNGPGVADDRLGRLFERFYRAEQGRSRAGGGSGLGLSICRNIVEAHGGRIWAQRSELGGLAIRAEFPR